LKLKLTHNNISIRLDYVKIKKCVYVQPFLAIFIGMMKWTWVENVARMIQGPI